MKKYSSKRSVQILAHLLKEYGIEDVVVSPGSRNAPISIHFAETDAFHCYSIVDERSAAFVALGMAVATQKPTAVTCTSGSAAVNYYPAVTEAFYQNIPMLLLTADRPTDFVDIFDGQTIRQKDLYHQHSYGDFQLLEDEEDNADEYNFNTIKTAIELCIEKSGPVHINIPLSEPLYELVQEIPTFPSVESLIPKNKYELPASLVAEWNLSKRILILVGTQAYNAELEALLTQLVKNHTVVVLTEANSNLHNPKFFSHIDRYISDFTAEECTVFAPDLLITIGQNVVSKKVKQFLRKAQPKAHWHINKYWHPDTYFCLSQKINTTPEIFFSKLLGAVTLEPHSYFNLWENLRQKKDALHNQYAVRTGFSDFHFFELLSQKIPMDYHIHFSNSSAIRYAQLFDFSPYRVYCNRGTSGIEGATSTAMGYAIKNEKPTLLVTGDISFLYDINGLWNQYIPPFTRVIIFNNAEGNIFKIIPGPTNANENVLDEFITTRHKKTAQHIAQHFGFGYVKVEDEVTLERVLNNFFKPDSQPKILEVMTSEVENAHILKEYFKYLSIDSQGGL